MENKVLKSSFCENNNETPLYKEIMGHFTAPKNLNYKSLSSSKKSYIIALNNNKEKFMSFVGILKLNDAVFAFSDRRNTEGGYKSLTKPDVRKLYHNENLIITACGNSKIISIDNEEEDLDDVMLDFVEKNNCNLKSFIVKFKGLLNEKLCSSRFFFIAYDRTTYIFYKFEIQNGVYSLIDANDKGFVEGAPWLHELVIDYLYKYKLETHNALMMERLFKEQISPMISFIDNNTLFYSSVSPEFDILIDDTNIISTKTIK